MKAFSVTEAMVAWIGALGHAASQDVPSPMPDEFVTVERTGGGATGLIDHPVVAVQCWAPTAERAEATANALRLALVSSVPPPGIHLVEASAGPYKFNDPESRRARWQMVLAVHCQLAI